MEEKLKELLFPDLKLTREELEKRYPKRDLKEGSYVTRFAPSPTGMVHMGSLYSAFISSVYASQTDGVFFLRIEDTDKKREIPNGVNLILEDLKRYQYKIDEGPTIGGSYGPYIQSERKEIYHAFVADLIMKGLAYPSFTTEEELAKMRSIQEATKARIGYYGKYATDRNLTYDEIKKKIDAKIPYVIRLKSPGNYDNKIEAYDEIIGKVTFPENDLDIVLLKADGIPTYHFAHAVDDYLMHTTHVIRGNEWLPSLPIHLQLFQILGVKAPKFAHLAPLTKKDGNSIRKLSKRKDPEATIRFYDEAGIPVMAIKLFLSTLMNANFEPWYLANPTASFTDFKFSFKKMGTGGTLFDLEKLMNISKTYISRMTNKEVYQNTLDYTEKYDKEFYQILKDNKDTALAAFQIERGIKRPRKDIGGFADVKKEFWYFFDEYWNNFDDKYRDHKNYDKDILREYASIFDLNDSKDEWFNKIKELGYRHGYAKEVKEFNENPSQYKGHVGDVCEMIRYAITSRLKTPDLYEILLVLGKDRVKERIEEFLKVL